MSKQRGKLLQMPPEDVRQDKTAKDLFWLNINNIIDKCGYCLWKGGWHWEVLTLICCDFILHILSSAGNTGTCFVGSGRRGTHWINRHAAAFTLGEKKKALTLDVIELRELRWKGWEDGGVYAHRLVRVCRGVRGRFLRKKTREECQVSKDWLKQRRHAYSKHAVGL